MFSAPVSLEREVSGEPLAQRRDTPSRLRPRHLGPPRAVERHYGEGVAAPVGLTGRSPPIGVVGGGGASEGGDGGLHWNSPAYGGHACRSEPALGSSSSRATDRSSSRMIGPRVEPRRVARVCSSINASAHDLRRSGRGAEEPREPDRLAVQRARSGCRSPNSLVKTRESMCATAAASARSTGPVSRSRCRRRQSGALARVIRSTPPRRPRRRARSALTDRPRRCQPARSAAARHVGCSR